MPGGLLIASHTFDGLLPLHRRLNVAGMTARLVTIPISQRRAAARYQLRLPVIFHWSDQTHHTEGGFTRDVGRDGAFIISSKCPPVGSDVWIEILLPSLDEASPELRVECMGKVTRVESGFGYKGFGVCGQFDDDQLSGHAPV
jgi:hypothetical protein